VFNSLAVGGSSEYQALSDQISAEWITFAHDGTPNGENLPEWPSYDSLPEGANFVLQTESQGGSQVEPDTYRLAGREFLIKWQRRRHV
jgi:carboxylesterase type B